MADRLVLDEPNSLEPYVGKELGVSDWLEMTQERIDLFAQATNDKQWIHTDPERAAKDSPYGTTIAHGHLTMSLTPFFLSQILEVGGAGMLVNPGVERVRLRSPVRCGDRIRMRASLKSLRTIPGGGHRATISLKIEIEGESRPAAFGDAHLVYVPPS